MADEKWREWINSLRTDDLPEDGEAAPAVENLPKKKSDGKMKVFVQVIMTKAYVYTDLNNKLYGQQLFQDAELLGEMSVDRLLKIIEKERRKRDHQQGS